MLQAFVDATTHIDRAMFRTGAYEPLYVSGVYYRAESRGAPAPGVERFQTLSSQRAVGADDCDGLASARAAERLEAGEWSRAWAVPSGSGWHIITLYRDGDGRIKVEDPSARLGMLGGVSMANQYSVDDIETVGVARSSQGRCVAAVGAIVGPYTFSAVGAAHESELDTVEPERTRHARTRALAARRALRRLTDTAAAVATTPEHVATRAVDAGARSAARAVTVRANRARADVDALEALDAPDEQGGAVDGLGVFDEWAEKLYARR